MATGVGGLFFVNKNGGERPRFSFLERVVLFILGDWSKTSRGKLLQNIGIQVRSGYSPYSVLHMIPFCCCVVLWIS